MIKQGKWVEAWNLHLKPGDLVSYSDNDWLGGDKVTYVRGYGVVIYVNRSQLWAEIVGDKKRIIELKYLKKLEELSEVSE